MTTRSPTGVSPAGATMNEERPQREFHLLRFFSIASGIAILAVALILSWAHYIEELDDQIELNGAQNATLARTFANNIHPEFDAYLFREKSGTARPAGDPQTQKLHDTLARMSIGIPVVKIVIYDPEGRTIYSTERKEFGESKSHNSLFRLARSGKTSSELTRRGRVSKSKGEIARFDLISTYIPITGADGRVTAVFELYSDVTAAVARIKQANLRLLAGLIVPFACLYGILLLIVGRADRILQRQYRELKRKEMQISAKNRELHAEIAGRQEVEMALRESEKIAAKANRAKTEFLSGVSHELRTPVIVVSAFSDLGNRLKALQLGARDYILKPFEVPEVIQRIMNHLEVRMLYRERRRQSEILETRVREQVAQVERLSRLQRVFFPAAGRADRRRHARRSVENPPFRCHRGLDRLAPFYRVYGVGRAGGSDGGAAPVPLGDRPADPAVSGDDRVLRRGRRHGDIQ